MTFFSADGAGALVDLQLAALASMVQSVPFGALVLMAAIALGVSWLSWTESRSRATPGRAGSR